MERITKGIWIPLEIWEDRDLSWNEKILFCEIDSFTSQEMDCFFSNEYIANLLNCTETTANKVLSSLIKKGYVVKTKFDGRRRYVKSALTLSKAGLPFPTRQGCSFEQGRVADTDNIINNINNKDYNISQKRDKSSRFTPPSVDEVREYCRERCNNVDAQRFVDFYEAKGWMIGPNKMKSWKAAVRTWEGRGNVRNSGGTNHPVQEKNSFGRMCDMLMDLDREDADEQ